MAGAARWEYGYSECHVSMVVVPRLVAARVEGCRIDPERAAGTKEGNYSALGGLYRDAHACGVVPVCCSEEGRGLTLIL
eukprot:1157510-Pelagomonas_calceolata.AAC.8